MRTKKTPDNATEPEIPEFLQNVTQQDYDLIMNWVHAPDRDMPTGMKDPEECRRRARLIYRRETSKPVHEQHAALVSALQPLT